MQTSLPVVENSSHHLSPTHADEKNKKYSAWTQLWRKEWSYTQWIISSSITSAISAEIYSLSLGIYPNFMLNLWIAIGISSATIATFLTYSVIGMIGLLTGWLVYSAHLAVTSMRAVNKDYQPLIDLWTSFNQDQKEIINSLLTDEHFLKLSKFLSEQTLPEPILAFLQKSQNFSEIKKLMELLKKIWSIDHMGDKLKELTLSILSDFVTDGNAAEKIEKISSLCQLLIQTNQFNQEMVTKTLENRSAFNPYLSQLQTLTSHQDLLHRLIEEPKLMPFYIAIQERFADQSERISDNTESLYFYLSYELVTAQALNNFLALKLPTSKPLNIKPEIYNWLRQDYLRQAQGFIQLWDGFVHHPLSDAMQATFKLMLAHDKYRPLLTNQDSCLNFLAAFNRPSILQESNYPTLFASLNHILQPNMLPLFCDILLKMHTSARLTPANVELLINRRNFEFVHRAMNSRADFSADDLMLAIEHTSMRVIPAPIVTPVQPARRRGLSKLFGCLSTENEPRPTISAPVIRR